MLYLLVSAACALLSLRYVCLEPDFAPGGGRTPRRYTVAESACFITAVLYFLLFVTYP